MVERGVVVVRVAAHEAEANFGKSWRRGGGRAITVAQGAQGGRNLGVVVTAGG